MGTLNEKKLNVVVEIIAATIHIRPQTTSLPQFVKMRRIPRLRRPAGLSATTSLSSISPLASSCSHTSTRNISISHRKPAPTNLQCSTFARFYSSEKQPSTGNLNREVDGAQGKEVNEAQEKEPVQLAAEQPNTETSNPKVDEAPTKEVDEAQLKGVDGSQGKELATVTAIKPSGIEGDSAYTEEQTRPVEQWDAYVPPPRRSHAERYDEVSDTRYYPALTADGLEAVGRLDNWWELPEHWSNDFAGFKPQEKVLDSALIETSVRRAVIEAYALKLSGQDDKLVGAWPIGGARDQYRVLEANINVAETGAVSLTGDISAIAESLNHTDEANIVGEQTTEDHAETLTSKSSSNKSMPSIEEARKFRGAWGHGWKAVSLSDPRIKFAVRLFHGFSHAENSSRILLNSLAGQILLTKKYD